MIVRLVRAMSLGVGVACLARAGGMLLEHLVCMRRAPRAAPAQYDFAVRQPDEDVLVCHAPHCFAPLGLCHEDVDCRCVARGATAVANATCTPARTECRRDDESFDRCTQ